MVGGKDNTNQVYFPEWIHIEQETDAEIAKKLAVVGLWSIQWYPVDHLSMKAVVQMLKEKAIKYASKSFCVIQLQNVHTKDYQASPY